MLLRRIEPGSRSQRPSLGVSHRSPARNPHRADVTGRAFAHTMSGWDVLVRRSLGSFGDHEPGASALVVG